MNHSIFDITLTDVIFLIKAKSDLVYLIKNFQVFTKVGQVHVYIKVMELIKSYTHAINILILNAHPDRFLSSHMQIKKSEARETLEIFVSGYKLFISYLPCHQKGYYLLEQVVVLQKDHAGMGHLCRIERSFVLSTI